jgi:hypothetical protein
MQHYPVRGYTYVQCLCMLKSVFVLPYVIAVARWRRLHQTSSNSSYLLLQFNFYCAFYLQEYLCMRRVHCRHYSAALYSSTTQFVLIGLCIA